MGHHLTDKGEFQSDKFPDLEPDKIVLSFKDPIARDALEFYASGCSDRELASDINERLKTLDA